MTDLGMKHWKKLGLQCMKRHFTDIIKILFEKIWIMRVA